jgi:peptidoglycan/xylan/chitin deacetylase (PgdA/CDA1 family)
MHRIVVLSLLLAAAPLHAEPQSAPISPAVVKPAVSKIVLPKKQRADRSLVEPSLHLAANHGLTPRVALTLDACSGKTDMRILDTLVDNRIPATIFITARWLKHNPETLAVFKAHPELFSLEDHGRDHVPAVDKPASIYGIKAAGSPEAVFAEVDGGTVALMAAGVAKPTWFRGATAKYTTRSVAQIEAMGYLIAGDSLNGDGGSLLGEKVTARRIAGARDGDVIIAHINQPTHAAGSGVAKGIMALKAKGYTFVRLNDAIEDGSDETTN